MAKVLRTDLLNELKKAIAVVPKISVEDILKNILVEVKNNKFKLSATDSITSIVTSFDYDGGMLPEEFSFIVDGKLFHDIINKISSSEIDITIADENVNIKGERSTFSIAVFTEDVKQFPEIESISNTKSITLKSNVLKEIVSNIIGFISEDDTRPMLGAVNFDFSKEQLVGVSLDGYRLGHVLADVNNDEEVSFQIPGKSLSNIIKALDEETVAIRYNDVTDIVAFDTGNTIIYTKQITGSFFNYKELMDKLSECSTSITVNTAELTNAVDRANILTRQSKKNTPIVFKIEDKTLIMNSNTEIGNIEEKIELEEFEGDSLERIAFNPKYILEGLKVCRSDSIQLKFISELNPGFILDKENDFTYFALPIRLVS